MTRTRPTGPNVSPKLLVLVDDSPECDRALIYAARRAVHFQARLLLLAVVRRDDFASENLFGVSDVIRAEAHQAARNRLDKAVERLQGLVIDKPDVLIREGEVAESVLNLIEQDHSILALVLGAGTGKEGPGPLVSSLARNAGHFPVPVIVVPGHLSDQDLAAIT